MKNINRHLLPAAVLLSGLFAAQVLFTLIVYASNTSLYRHLSGIMAAGYLTVPNALVMQTLKKSGPAFCGALFFTMTTGAGLSLATLALLWCMKIFPGRKRFFAVLILAAWGFIVFLINTNGPNPLISVAFILIPAVTGTVFIRLYPADRMATQRRGLVGHIIAFTFILAVWIPHLNADTFVRIRDDLLLSNPLGQRLNDFYYRYTLYPAEVFKSFDQKLLKTCNLQVKNHGLFEQFERRLRRWDYLTIDTDFPVDLTVRLHNHRLLLLNRGRAVLATTPAQFSSDVQGMLKTFSEKCDRNVFFRKITLLSLVAGLPIACYILLHAGIMLLLFLLPSPSLRFWSATIACLLIGVTLTIPLYNGHSARLSKGGIFTSLQSSNRRERVAALRTACEKQLAIDQCQGLYRIKSSPYVPERYWLARALGYGHTPETFKMILSLLKDPHPNVVCMALYSLGKRGGKQDTAAILRLIQTSQHWYVQWYAYNALKRLKWIQPKSTHSHLSLLHPRLS